MTIHIFALISILRLYLKNWMFYGLLRIIYFPKLYCFVRIKSTLSIPLPCAKGWIHWDISNDNSLNIFLRQKQKVYIRNSLKPLDWWVDKLCRYTFLCVFCFVLFSPLPSLKTAGACCLQMYISFSCYSSELATSNIVDNTQCEFCVLLIIFYNM